MNNYLNTISPYIRVAMDSKITPPYKLERVIFDYELLYVKDGHVIITINDQVYKGKPGDIFLLKPKEKHILEVYGSEIFHQPHLHFDFNYEENSPDIKVCFQKLEELDESSYKLFRKDITNNLPFKIPNYIKLKNTQYFEKMLFDIINQQQSKLPFYEIQMKGMFIQLYTYLIREIFYNNNPHISSTLNRLSEIKDYIGLNIHKDLALAEIEQEFSISRYHIIRLFKDAYGMTPIHFHQFIRIEKAKEMIQFTDYPITQISEIFGFSSIHSFSRAFKKIDKVTPSYYRRR